ncbi:MAG: hypothetical protein KKI08_08650 [Armatimonadetes bacterium]|nr:hypothetical protein [Armatimonadota bacterium]
MRVPLAGRVSAEIAAHLAEIGRLAAEMRLPAYLVGGPVRDALLGRPSLDVDVCVEGDAARLAERLAERLQGRLTSHERFGTAVVESAGWHVDVATARRETYPRPGALPVVEPAGLEEDLRRRDFAYNAMALRLDRDLGLLCDPLGGLDDLQAGRTRGLHERTFVDDPTRIIRAARYAVRFGFPLEPMTRGWLTEAVAGGALQTVTGQRIWSELSRLLAEATAPEAVALLATWRVLSSLGLHETAVAEVGLLGEAQQALGLTDWDRAMAGLGLLAGARVSAVVAGYGLSAAEAGAVLAAAEAAAAPPPAVFAAAAKNSTLYEALDPLAGAGRLALWVRHPQARTALRRFARLTARLDIGGHDLQAEGFAPSPGFKPALAAALRAKLDDGAGRDGQLAAARAVLAHGQPPYKT